MFRLTSATTEPLIQQLLPIIGQASEILREEYQKYCAGDVFNIEHKSDNSPVTQADYRSNQYIVDSLKKISDLPILSEEGQAEHRSTWEQFWLLDPLDGTKEFLHQRPEFTINLSLVRGNHTVLAMLAVPCEQVVYIASEVGLPLKFNYKEQQWFIYEENIHLDKTIKKIGLSQSSQQRSQYTDYLESLSKLTEYSVFKAGSAYKFCMMLEDQVDIYPRFHPTCEWDTSAGQCLLEKIGGGLVNFKGKVFTYNQRNTLLNQGFIAYKNKQMKKVAFDALRLMSKSTQ
jgi:3'(2'), 5'-bisphosphate nucleotidase